MTLFYYSVEILTLLLNRLGWKMRFGPIIVIIYI